MDPIDRADAYLTIPPSYSKYYGGLRWSTQHEAIERQDGSALVLAEELSPILEGVFTRKPPVPFPFILALIHEMKGGTFGEFGRLQRAFQATSRSAAHGRNAGLLIAELCRELPHIERVLEWQDVSLALRCLKLYGEHYRSDMAREPALTPPEFDSRMISCLSQFDDQALLHWFKFGCDPNSGGEQLVQQEIPFVTRVARFLELARNSSRLVGAASLVPMLDAALTLPPRRRTSETVPQGGYCDVTTRGNPEQLLPTQFALDPDEFVRRYSANELLYFKREEPHQTQQPDRTIVLDLGVRTWGSVRLALAGATFSLLGRDPKQYSSLEFLCTSKPEPIELKSGDPESVIELLESSDLTLNPSECLKRALRPPVGKPRLRDLILLTHPRNLREAAVHSAVQLRQPGDRLFVVTVDEEGRSELNLWSGSGLTLVKSFKIDLLAAEMTKVRQVAKKSEVKHVWGEWTGDVEPIPFPFRPGLLGDPQLMAFDTESECLISVTREGVIHLIDLDGAPTEILPRAHRKGTVLKQVSAILGVTGGIVVCGRMLTPQGARIDPATGDCTIDEQLTGPIHSHTATYPVLPPINDYFVAAHYHWATRRVTLHFLCPAASSGLWSAHPHLFCIAVRTSSDPEKTSGIAIDLTTHDRFPSSQDKTFTSRAHEAWLQSAFGGTAPYHLEFHRTGRDGPFYQEGNSLFVRREHANWTISEPLEDGKPLLAGAVIHNAQLAGDVLAVNMSQPRERFLTLFRGSSGAVLGRVNLPRHGFAFSRNGYALSQDGSFLAIRDTSQTISISGTGSPAKFLVTASRAKLHNTLEVRLRAEPFQLTVAIGTFGHFFSLFEGRLRYSLSLGWDKYPDPQGSMVECTETKYDGSRFPATEVVGSGIWKAVVDRLGQVLLFAGDELAAAFAIRRDRAAVWIPGGIYWGDSGLIGGPPTPEADLKIGRAFAAASIRRRGV